MGGSNCPFRVIVCALQRDRGVALYAKISWHNCSNCYVWFMHISNYAIVLDHDGVFMIIDLGVCLAGSRVQIWSSENCILMMDRGRVLMTILFVSAGLVLVLRFGLGYPVSENCILMMDHDGV